MMIRTTMKDNKKYPFIIMMMLMMFICIVNITTINAFLAPFQLHKSPALSSPLSRIPSSSTTFATKRHVLTTLQQSSSSSSSSEKDIKSPLLKTTTSSSSSKKSYYKHTLAILTLPQTAKDRIANEAILETCLKYTTDKVSIVLRCQDSSYNNKTIKSSSSRNTKSSSTYKQPKIHELRGYVGEIYSLVWDSVLALDSDTSTSSSTSSTSSSSTSSNNNNNKQKNKNQLLDIIIYPQNLPNAAPEQWLHHRPDLQCICSHDSITGWISSTTSSSRGFQFSTEVGNGLGGLDAHVEAVNVDRRSRGLDDVEGLMVENWPEVCNSSSNDDCDIDGDGENIIFLEDDNEEEDDDDEDTTTTTMMMDSNDLSPQETGLIGGGYRIPSSSLYNSVAVGGTFDGMHYGHRKLLTLALSSVCPDPNGGKLLIGITTDEMLQSKTYAEFIPSLKERICGVRNFVDALAPGMKNRVKIIPIVDKYGPPGISSSSSSSSTSTSTTDMENPYEGVVNDFDALVLSHETLPTGRMLNKYRVQNLGLEPLTLLCTRRTEAHGMSSTVLRRLRKEQQAAQQQQQQEQEED